MLSYTCVHSMFVVMTRCHINILPNTWKPGSYFHLVDAAKPNAEVPRQREYLWKLCLLPMFRALPVSLIIRIYRSISIENALETRKI